MNILPRLIFLLSSIPMKFPQKWFSEINKQFSIFLWKENRPRISLRKLSIPRKRGGLGVPDIYTYYLALNAQYPLSWAYKKDTSTIGSWSWLEHRIVVDACKNISLASFWYKPKYDKRIQNSLIHFSCEIAQVIQKKLMAPFYHHAPFGIIYYLQLVDNLLLMMHGKVEICHWVSYYMVGKWCHFSNLKHCST